MTNRGDKQVSNVLMSKSPSAVTYGDKLYCFYQGGSSNGELWYDVFDGNRWAGEVKVPNLAMISSPSAVVYNDKIYCFHQGYGNSGELWYDVFDGSSWAGDVQVSKVVMSEGPSAVVYGNKIYCFHQGDRIMVSFGMTSSMEIVGLVIFRFRKLSCRRAHPPWFTTTKFIVSIRVAQVMASFGTTFSMGVVGLVMLKCPTFGLSVSPSAVFAQFP